MAMGSGGLDPHLASLSCLRDAQSRSISAENPTGAKGEGGKATEGTGAVYARELGQGWKISPSIPIEGKSTAVLADIEGSGAIVHMWMGVLAEPISWRQLVFRCYWDGEEAPSVEVPLGDFFCNGWCVPCLVNSFVVAVNPRGGFNCYWQMPFRRNARITIENLSPDRVEGFYYQINYVLTEVPDDRAYFHAQWRRTNPLPYMDVHTLLDSVRGQGQYVGTYMAWGTNSNGWWGEGEFKFYLDGDTDWPTICGTGTEDYFGGAWNWEQPKGEYGSYSTPFLGLPQIIKPDGYWHSQQRFGMYRWHVTDPIHFKQDLRITVQALGWRQPLEGKPRYLPLQEDIASTSFWYQTHPHAPFPELPDINALEPT